MPASVLTPGWAAYGGTSVSEEASVPELGPLVLGHLDLRCR